MLTMVFLIHSIYICYRITQSVKPTPKRRGSINYSQVETISEKCRPSNIGLLYNNLESQEWVDAKEALEDDFDFDEEDIIRFLCNVLMVSFVVHVCTFAL